MTVPNRIVLIARGRYDEAAANADVYPGMILQQQAADLSVKAHPNAGGAGPLLICQEDALQGGDITQKIASGNVVPFRRVARGDEYLCLLQLGQNVANQAALMSAGDGTLIVNPGTKLLEILTGSTTISSITVATTFSNSTYAFAANFLQVGDVIHVRGKAVVEAQNSTNTNTIQILLGTDTIANSGAWAIAANGYVNFDVYITVRTLGNATVGTIVASGSMAGASSAGVGAASITMVVSLASTNLDTTVAETLKVTCFQSASSAGNSTSLEELQVDLNRTNGLNTILIAQEAINNATASSISVGGGSASAAFIRCIVP
jgi:hypothetical protein